MTSEFDPDGPASGGLFGLPHTTESARVCVLGVPFEATTSYGSGTAAAPDAVVEASWQVDLCDPETGEPWRDGIALDETPAWVRPLSDEAHAAAARARDGNIAEISTVDAATDKVRRWVRSWTDVQLDAGRIPAILGGEHSVPLGAMQAALARNPDLSVLQVDAHADLREAYEGFEQSHASIFHNYLELGGSGPLIQVGLRDFGVRERERAADDGRVSWWTDRQISEQLADGRPFGEIADEIVSGLSNSVWISFDIDGLDPSLCPGTGTPVPGGLSWREAMVLLARVGLSGRRIVGFDLCEVGASSFDANVGARVLYKLSGWAIASTHRMES